MASVAEREVFRLTASAGPDRAVFFHRDCVGSFARALVGTVAVGRIFGLPTGAQVQSLSGLGVDLVGGGLPDHGLIIRLT